MSGLITVERVLAWHPCEHYNKARLRRLIGGGLTLGQVLGKRILAEDKIWVATRPGVLAPGQEKAWLKIVVCRAVRTHCLRCGVPEVETWAEKYLSGEDKTFAAAAAAYAACTAAAAWNAVRAAKAAAWSTAAYAADAADAADAARAAYAAYADAAAFAAYADAADAYAVAYAATLERERQVADLRKVLAATKELMTATSSRKETRK